VAGRGKAAAASGAWIVFEDGSGCVLRPPHAKTWGRRGQTPIVTVRGRGSGRVNIVGLTCYRPGHRSRLFYRLLVYHGRMNEKKGFGWADYRDLLTAAHRQLGSPLIVIWDNARTHWMPGIQAFACRTRLADLIALPKYAPEINPTEGIWSLIKRGPLANLVPVGLDELAGTVRFALKRIQYRPELVDGCLAETGLIIRAP
jgi:DDE superfamily endonuclease